MDPASLVFLVVFLGIAVMTALRSVRQVNQWETGLKFTFGKFAGLAAPGLNFVVPGVQRLVKIDTRVRNRDLPQQAVITADNVTAWIDAVIYFKVVDVERATLNVQDYENAVRDRAKVVLRDVVGETKLDDLLSHREEVAAKVRAAVEQFVAQWGLHVELIALQDIQLPKQMQEVIARKAIAERDRQYVIIKSQADLESAKNFAEAARILHTSPGGMELRRLEALQNLSGGTTKVIFDLAKPFGDTQTAAVAAAMGANVRVADEEPQPAAAGIEDPEAEENAPPVRPAKRA
ncbi:MAG TPA: SPFH domain-containing protein [Labilithrix sp.]|nr:SPFH domain-containing protein [Labilithrix sp.]